MKPISLLFGAVALLAALWTLMHHLGGLPPSYPARDHDPRLAKTAATAKPLIAAIDRYFEQHGRFPADLASAITTEPGGWTYTPIGSSGYSLSKKLGWDPSLHYRYQNGLAQWVFDPGDGTPESVIIL